MRRTALFFTLAALLLAGCHRGNKPFDTHTVSDERCFIQVFDEPFIKGLDTIGIRISYSVEWPNEGTVSEKTLRELQYLCFYDSTAVDIADAVELWMGRDGVDGWFFYGDEYATLVRVDSLDEGLEYSYIDLQGTCNVDRNLALFTIHQESYPFGAAHGMHSTDFLTVDLETGDAIHLADLVTDTNLLCEAVAHAIQDLEVNREVRKCLFDEFVDAERMPLPHNFTIDSARNGITVYYGLYEITPYACGIQEVVLPIFWLSKHVALTPYAKRLFGPESSIIVKSEE